MAAKRTPSELLSEFRRHRRNRRLGEWLGLLETLGWRVQPSKSGVRAKKGRRTLSMHTPHGGDDVVKLGMAATILREIDLAELEGEEEAETRHDPEAKEDDDEQRN